MKGMRPQFIDLKGDEWIVEIESGSRVDIEGRWGHGLKGHGVEGRDPEVHWEEKKELKNS